MVETDLINRFLNNKKKLMTNITGNYKNNFEQNINLKISRRIFCQTARVK